MGGTNYASAFEAFRKKAEPFTKPDDAPWYLIFITDGQDYGSKREVIRHFQELSSQPVFVQCIALGADYDPNGSKGGWFSRGNGNVPSDFEFLAKLDSEVPNRLIDNCNFFAIETPSSVSDEELLKRMMGEFPQWLKEAKAKGLVK